MIIELICQVLVGHGTATITYVVLYEISNIIVLLVLTAGFGPRPMHPFFYSHVIGVEEQRNEITLLATVVAHAESNGFGATQRSDKYDGAITDVGTATGAGAGDDDNTSTSRRLSISAKVSRGLSSLFSGNTSPNSSSSRGDGLVSTATLTSLGGNTDGRGMYLPLEGLVSVRNPTEDR